MEALAPAVESRRVWRSDRVMFLGLIVVATANALLWAFTIPFNEAPDEAAHFQVVRFILDHGRLPLFSPDELWLHNTSKGWVESYAPFPPLAYVVGALASRLTDGTMWGARMVSVASYVATVALTFLIARCLVPRTAAIAVCAALVVAFLPQFAFTAAYVNSDAIGVAITALLLYLLLRLRSEGRAVWLMLAIGVAAGALLLTKYTFYPAAAVGVAVAAWRIRTPPQGLALIGGVGATAGWWFVRNWLLYGEGVPVRVIADAKAAAGGNTLFVPADYGITMLDISWRTDFWWASFTSFVGKFGFLSIEMHPVYYLACLALLALALAGGGTALLRSRDGRQPVPFGVGRGPVGVALAVIVGTALFAMFSSATGEYSPQGRYLFAALVPIVLCLVVGWSSLGALIRAPHILPIGATLGLVALNFVALFGYVVPAHFGYFPDVFLGRVVVQADPSTDPAGGSIQIAGWAFAEGYWLWLPYSPDAVERYRLPASEVLVYADAPPPSGRLLGIAQYGSKRTDVDTFYGGLRRIEDIGYRFNLVRETQGAMKSRIYVCAATRGMSACTPQDLDTSP